MTFLAPAGLRKHKKWQRFLATFPPQLSAMLTREKPQVQTCRILCKDSKTQVDVPNLSFYISHTNTLPVHLQTDQSHLASQYNCRLKPTRENKLYHHKTKLSPKFHHCFLLTGNDSITVTLLCIRLMVV